MTRRQRDRRVMIRRINKGPSFGYKRFMESFGPYWQLGLRKGFADRDRQLALRHGRHYWTDADGQPRLIKGKKPLLNNRRKRR